MTDKSTAAILWLTLNMKDNTDIGLLLCVCYLPHEGSSRGNVSWEFFYCLLSQLYLHYDGNPTLMLGDYMKGMKVIAMSRTYLSGSPLTICVIRLEII